MTKVREIMSQPVEHAHLDDAVLEAAVRMRSAEVGGLPVLDGDRLVGMITDRDIVLRVVAEARDPRLALVREAFTADVVHCKESHTLEEAAAIMEGSGVRRLPVLDNSGTLVGMLSAGDYARRGYSRAATGKIVGATGTPSPRNMANRTSYDSGPKLKP